MVVLRFHFVRFVTGRRHQAMLINREATMFDAFCKHTLIPLLLRLALAAVFIFHGIDLVSHEGGTAWHPELPVPAQAAVAWGQLLGGIALALGFLTRLAAAGLVVIMGGAIYTVHWEHGFSNQDK